MLFSITITVLSSCKKFVELPPPATQLTNKDVFASDATAISLVSNIYTQFAASNFASGRHHGITMLAGISADELDCFADNTTLSEEVFGPFSSNGLLPKNMNVLLLWTEAYIVIYRTNLILEGLAQSTGVSTAVKNQLMGEALFIRAFTHFYLANMFGRVPYVTSTDYRLNNVIKQIEYTAALKLIIEDLKAAKILLATDYIFSGSERVKPTKWAASAFLARTYLYNEEWENAEKEATEVIDQQTLFSLIDLKDVFIKNSKETIWQIKPLNTNSNLNTNEGSIFILEAKPSSFALRDDFVNGMEAGDLRKQHWVGRYSSAAGSWYFPYKYKIKTGATPFNEYSMVLRLAEQYLIRSEARARQSGKLSTAIQDVDAIRFRAGLPKIGDTNSSITQEELLLAIENERKSEFMAEWGHRWLDLKRTGRIDEVLSAKKTSWTSTAVLFPIPSEELRKNKSLTQNNGYPND